MSHRWGLQSSQGSPGEVVVSKLTRVTTWASPQAAGRGSWLPFPRISHNRAAVPPEGVVQERASVPWKDVVAFSCNLPSLTSAVSFVLEQAAQWSPRSRERITQGIKSGRRGLGGHLGEHRARACLLSDHSSVCVSNPTFLFFLILR